MDTGTIIQEMFEKRYFIYTNEVVEPILSELKKIETEVLEEFARDAGLSEKGADIDALLRALNHIRSLERTIEIRRAAIERLSLDGPAEWLTSFY